MPQMFPMYWTTMFMMFIITYILVTLLINYNFTNQPLLSTPMVPKAPLSWKW